MARSTLDTLVYATILVAPLATALGYIALQPDPEVVVVAAPVETCPEDQVVTLVGPAPIREPEPVPASIVVTDLPVVGAGNLLFERRLVLSTAPDTAWSRGPLRSHANDYGITVSKAADPARLPAGLAALAGQRFTVFAADGSACLIEAGAASIYARIDGDVLPEPEEGEPAGSRPAALHAARSEVFTDHAQLLLARTVGAPRCTGLWARRADLASPAVFGVRTLDSDAEAALTTTTAALLANHAAVLSLQTSYTAWQDELDAETRALYPTWSAFLRDSLHVQRWDEVGGPRGYLTVDVGSDGEACSNEFAGHVSLVLARTDDPANPWQVLADPGFWHPVALMDLDRDGHLEAVTRGGAALETRGPDTGLAQSFEIPWWGCPC